MSKLLTCLMFIPLAVVTYWEITTHSHSFPVSIGFVFTVAFAIWLTYKHDLEKHSDRFPY